MTYQSIKETNLAVDEGHHYDEQSKETTMMKSFTLSWKKVATVCATFVGCTVLYVLSTSGGHEGGGIANVDQLGTYPGYPCYVQLLTLQELGMKDGIFDFQVEVIPHMYSNGRYVSSSRHQYKMKFEQGHYIMNCDPACADFRLRVEKPTDWLEVHAEEVDRGSASDWSRPERKSNLCDRSHTDLDSWFGTGKLHTVFKRYYNFD